MQKLLSPLCVIAALCALGGTMAHAAEIDGVWVTDAAVCDKVYQKKGNQISFADTADLHGSGFILDGNRLRGKIAQCNVKTRRVSGDLVHIIANCSTDIAIEPVQFTLKFLGPDKVVRVFPDLPELNTQYARCSF